ncbi:PaaI family thioesterase [Paracoccaceae bacterium GXU_MW_L88]
MKIEDKQKLAKSFISAIPHSEALGMEIGETGWAYAYLSIPYNEKFIGNPETGVLHGGVVTALLDTCCGTAVLMHPRMGGATATIDLRIDYMRPAKPGARLTARADCYHTTRSVAFVRAVAYADDPNAPVAMATGAFTFTPAPDAPTLDEVLGGQAND